MPMVRAMRMLNAVEAGTLSGAQLETLLTTDPGRLSELNVLLGMRGQARRLCASQAALVAVLESPTATARLFSNPTSNTATGESTSLLVPAVAAANMTAVAASSTAMTAVAASSTAMTAVIASSTAMTAVWASNTATDAVLASATARLAVYNADTALAALQANPTQVQRKVTSGAINASTASQSFVFVANGTRVILLRRYYNGTEPDMINWARGSTSAAVGQGPAGGGRNLDTGAQALGCVSGSYTSNGIMPTANDATGNFVSAANGLQRRTWTNGANLYVYYILV